LKFSAGARRFAENYEALMQNEGMHPTASCGSVVHASGRISPDIRLIRPDPHPPHPKTTPREPQKLNKLNDMSILQITPVYQSVNTNPGFRPVLGPKTSVFAQK
jgi:hypothetical protein